MACSSRTTVRRGKWRACRAIQRRLLGNFDQPARVIEDGLEFQAPLTTGQKTGWFFDQAANRRALSKYIRPQARVLDVFSYVGAWGVRAAHHGAQVTCVDSSAAALEGAAANAARNGVKLTTRKGDAFDVLEELAKEGAKFDVVIIDPPAFAKRKKDLPEGPGRIQAPESAGDGRGRG